MRNLGQDDVGPSNDKPQLGPSAHSASSRGAPVAADASVQIGGADPNSAPGSPARSTSSTDRPAMARATRALGWSLLNTAASRLGTLGIGIALARMLGPEEFGTFAVATVALLAVLSFNELGVSLAIVRWPVEPDAIAPTVTTISAATSAAIAVTGVGVAPYFAAAMGAPQATLVVQVMMASVLINGLVATPAALLQRYFMQSRRMVIDQINVWLGAFTSILLAAFELGAMSLAIGRVVGSAVSAVLFFVYSPTKYRFGFARAVVPGLLKFGMPLAGASVVVFALSYADQIITGHRLGTIELGYYVLAFNLASWPVSIFSQPLRSVAPAAFSAIQRDAPRMRSTLTSVIGVLATVSIPCCLVIAGAARSIVTFVYGTSWQPAAKALFWLAIFAAFRIVFELIYDYLVVLGRSGPLLRIQIIGVFAVVPAMLLGAHLAGIAGVAASQVAVAAVVTLPVYVAELRRAAVRLQPLWRRIWPSASCAVLIGAAAYWLSVVMSSPFLALVISGLLALMVVSGLLLRDRSEIATLRESRPAWGAQ